MISDGSCDTVNRHHGISVLQHRDNLHLKILSIFIIYDKNTAFRKFENLPLSKLLIDSVAKNKSYSCSFFCN